MEFFPFMIGLILLIFGTILGGVLLWKVIDMIRGTIKGKRNQEYEKSFDKMARAFIQHKKDTQRRLKNIEVIIAQDEPSYDRIEIDEPKEDIENSAKRNSNINKSRAKK